MTSLGGPPPHARGHGGKTGTRKCAGRAGWGGVERRGLRAPPVPSLPCKGLGRTDSPAGQAGQTPSTLWPRALSRVAALEGSRPPGALWGSSQQGQSAHHHCWGPFVPVPGPRWCLAPDQQGCPLGARAGHTCSSPSSDPPPTPTCSWSLTLPSSKPPRTRLSPGWPCFQPAFLLGFAQCPPSKASALVPWFPG